MTAERVNVSDRWYNTGRQRYEKFTVTKDAGKATRAMIATGWLQTGRGSRGLSHELLRRTASRLRE
jgi:hypothetical protein